MRPEIEQTTRQVVDIAIGSTAASLPFWALELQNWALVIGATAGALLTVLRLAQFFMERRRRR